jgi:hypothetical protein
LNSLRAVRAPLIATSFHEYGRSLTAGGDAAGATIVTRADEGDGRAAGRIGIERGPRCIRDCNYCFHEVVTKAEAQLTAEGIDEQKIKSPAPTKSSASNRLVPEDEAAARQETDYVNHVFMQQNPGFMILYCFIKDALISKVGIVKVWWEEREEASRETSHDLTDDQFALLAQAVMESDGATKIVAHTVHEPMLAPEKTEATS